MKISIRHFFVFLIFCTPIQSIGSVDSFQSEFAKVVKSYWRPAVKVNGISTTVFDFKKMASDYKSRTHPMRIAEDALVKIDMSKMVTGVKEKTFLINLYNFAAMRLIVKNYPVDSIRSFKISLIKYPWSKKDIVVGKRRFSLKQIEKEILLEKYPDPRVAFAVSCAAVSCPDRTSDIFRPETLEKQMDEMVRTFLKNDKKGFAISKEKKTITLSWIFDKDGHLFKALPEGGALGFVLRYLDPTISKWIRENRRDLTIDYFEHYWALNDLALMN